MLPEKGNYIAGIVQSGIKVEDGKCPSFDMYFECRQVLDAGQWVAANGERITESFNLIKKDGQPNEINVRNLKEALGWDGASFASLNGDWSQTEVQIKVDDESGQDGKTYRCVKYINHRDYAGPSVVAKADVQSVTSLDQKYGAVLRALSGTVKPAKPVGKAPGMMKPEKSNGTPGVTPEVAKGQCWKAFSDKISLHVSDFPDDLWDDTRRVRVFRELIEQANPGKTSTTLTVAEWRSLQQLIEKDFSAAAGALIPF